MPGTRPGMTKLKGCRRRAAIESIARHQKSNPVRAADLRKATGILLSDFSERALTKRQSRCPNSDIEILKSTMGASHYRTG
jgi:hypothetical protein